MNVSKRKSNSAGRTWLWALPAIVWLLFCFWYTNIEGPLSEDEIDAFVEQMRRADAEPERIQRLRRFMEQDSGSAFLMANLLDMAEPNPAAPHTPEESMRRYMEHMYPELMKRACHPVLAGPVVYRAIDLAGIAGAQQWSDFAIMRYRSRRDLLEIALNPIFDSKHEFKIAALEKTIAVPVEPTFHFGDLRAVLFFILFFLIVIVDAIVIRRPDQTAPTTEATPSATGNN